MFKAKYGEDSVLVYVLYEHKSTPEWDSVFQVLRYMVELWRSPIGKHQAPCRIIPVIVYHGRARWNAPRTLDAYFSQSQPVEVGGPDLRPFFVEVDDLGAEVLERVSLYTRNAISSLKYYAERNKPAAHQKALNAALALPGRRPVSQRIWDLYRTSLDYILDISTEKQIPAILKVVEQTAGREFAMTAAEGLRKQGRQQAQREVLVRQMTKKFSITDEERQFIETVDDLDRLAAALDEILVAQTKEQVLALLR